MAISYVSVNDASKYLKTSKRAVQGRCKRNNVPQKNGVYKISINTINNWLNDKGFSLIGEDYNTNIANTKNDVRFDVENEVQVRNISEHQNIALKNKVEALETELLNYRKVLDVHSRIFKTITDKLENVTTTNKQNQNRDRVAEPFFKIATKKTEQEIEEGKLKLQAQLEKQFGYGVKHISINKELPNETPMNEVGFGTRLHHLHKLEDTYPTNSISRTENNETKTTITRRNEDGKLNTTSSKS